MSDILARKAKTYFKHLDPDNVGSVSLTKYLGIPDRLCEAEKADAAEREKTRACFANLWRKYMKSAGSDDNGLLTQSIFVESIIQQKNDPDFKKTYLAMCHQFFKVLDVNGDGFLQEDEYARSINGAVATDTGIARRAFELMDLNEDGKLSWEEFSIALVEHITSDDESNRYNGLWGPLGD